MVGQQLLEVALDPVLDQARVDPEVVGGVAEDLLDVDQEVLAGLLRTLQGRRPG